MDEQEIRLACVNHAADVVSRMGGGDVVKTAREIEGFVTGKSERKLLPGEAAYSEEITDTMKAAGWKAYGAVRVNNQFMLGYEIVAAIYRAMRAAAR